MIKKTLTAGAVIGALFLLVGCETTTGYRKTAGGQYAHKRVHVHIGKGVQISGNVIVDLDEGQSNTGPSEQGGTAEAAASGNEIRDNNVAPAPPAE